MPPGLESRQETANDCLGCSFSADEIHTRNLLGLPPGELEAAYYVRHSERHREQSPPRERRERTPVPERGERVLAFDRGDSGASAPRPGQHAPCPRPERRRWL